MARLSFIRHARELGFEVDAIRTLLQLQDQPDQPCAVADEIARARLAEVERRIASLVALRKELEKMINECACGRVAECRVIEALARPIELPLLARSRHTVGEDVNGCFAPDIRH